MAFCEFLVQVNFLLLCDTFQSTSLSRHLNYNENMSQSGSIITLHVKAESAYSVSLRFEIIFILRIISPLTSRHKKQNHLHFRNNMVNAPSILTTTTNHTMTTTSSTTTTQAPNINSTAPTSMADTQPTHAASHPSTPRSASKTHSRPPSSNYSSHPLYPAKSPPETQN